MSGVQAEIKADESLRSFYICLCTSRERIKDVWSRIFRKNVKSEISFYGEELMNAGNTARSVTLRSSRVLAIL